MELTKNKAVLDWIDQQVKLTQPKEVIWIDGSEAQLEELRKEACATGEIYKLNQEKLPGCYLHRSDPSDVARVESRTFICCKKQEDAGPTNNWMDPQEMYAKLNKLYDGSMKGKTMYVIPYCMSVVGSPFAKYGIELTDSIYVVLNMAIMTRVGTKAAAYLDENFIKGLHARGTLDPEERYIVQFPEDNVIMSINSGYGGNVLQGKKCFALRIASNLGRQEGWLAEHMLILGVQNPQGEVRYITGAFPSACGKTNLAMLIPARGLPEEGLEVLDAWATTSPGCVTGADGRLWAVNPENGFFGVAPGTNAKSNPNALADHQEGHHLHQRGPQPGRQHRVVGEAWTRIPPSTPWTGRATPGTAPTAAEGPAAHPNSRFTAPAENCPCISPEFENPHGVPISAIIFGGRRAKTAPLVYQSRDWQHGVFVGSVMASETTAAADGQGRRRPVATPWPCCPSAATTWATTGSTGWTWRSPCTSLPKIFNVNWFRTDDNGEFIWPGFGENLRVVEWILKRCFDEADARRDRDRLPAQGRGH